MANCAAQVCQAIREELAFLVPEPGVFLDTSIQSGTSWEGELKKALCKSLTMVALCSPIYYHKSHVWCGREWAAMEALRKKRIQNETLCNIIPLIVRESSALPEPVANIQWINLTPALMTGKRYYSTREFRTRVKEVVNLIEKVAFEIAENQVLPRCEGFEIPTESAFANWQPPALAASSNPFWGKRS